MTGVDIGMYGVIPSLPGSTVISILKTRSYSDHTIQRIAAAQLLIRTTAHKAPMRIGLLIFIGTALLNSAVGVVAVTPCVFSGDLMVDMYDALQEVLCSQPRHCGMHKQLAALICQWIFEVTIRTSVAAVVQYAKYIFSTPFAKHMELLE
ncbi:hypothetical protein B0H12DRAFT_1154675 [Mycena haematopus]|nr:hypothetical protein B0H12DRAFT_1154675 [Mycena haematopus]